ncbi:MAG: sulfotransferase domain-containing protein [Nostoc sp.]|uniref:sulfotransferase domain-containing protein n=1 Tax=Nostoc sp. TaxID=1180 RepID=UPI002FF4935A
MIFTQPNFIIIGTQKGGTTSLYNYLIQHPQIVPSSQKEIHFFDFQYQKGIDWYEAQFASKNSTEFLTGEASPYYIFHPLVPERIKQHYPHIKIIVLLRNPVDRAISHYYHEVRCKIETLCLKEAFAAELTRLTGETEKIISNPDYYSFNHQRYTYLSRGIYIEQLQNWRKYFPIEQFLILESESFYKNPESTVNQTFAFLGLPYYQLSQYCKYNVGNYPVANEHIYQYLTNYFEPYNQHLTAYLGREFIWTSTKKSFC